MPLQRVTAGMLLEALTDAVVMARGDGTIIAANHAAMVLFGLSALPRTVAELRGIVDARDSEGGAITNETSLFTRAARGEEARGRFRLRHAASGEERIVDAVVTPMRDERGASLATVLAMHDVTAIVEGDRQREEFLSIVSHELKTPLTPLKALAQLLRARARRSREGGQPLDVDSLDRNLATIERQVDRMNGLVNDLLEVSRAGRGTFQLMADDFDLVPVLHDAVQRYIDATQEEGRHRFQVDLPLALPMHGDQARIEQVLLNVLANAVKYSPRGGEVRVRVREDAAAAVVEVEDEGIGIPPEEIAALGAKPFSRGAGRSASFAGMGIGLYLSRLIVEGHGGTLELLSEGEGKGTTVRITLPRQGSG